jgi:5-formyltetrahydrofolate cyclo-ligase
MDKQPLSRTNIRKSKRKLRSTLTSNERDIAERGLARVGALFPQLRNATRVLSYIPVGGEISPGSLEKSLTKAQIYQPRITSFNHGLMRFYPASARKSRNRFGILEPAAIGTPMPAMKFDVVLVPLVAFDRTGNRLGMGAGFYDRAMAFRLNNPKTSRPLLVGLAHHFQEVNSLNAQAWDVPLDVILTDRELIRT